MITSLKSGRNAFFALASLLLLSTPALAIISAVSATPSPATVNTNAQYTLSFTTGAAGALTTSSTIIAVFPANTTLPASFPGGAGAQITVNGTTATATSAGQTLTITVPRDDIGNSDAVNVVITTGANNIVNPSIAGTGYRVTMSTSVEPTGVNSGTYSITASSTVVAIDSATPNPDTIGNYAQYDIQFDVAGDGDLWGCASTITIVFPSDTIVQNGAISGVTVEGVAAASATGTAASRTIVITPYQSITGGTGNINVIIPNTVVRNPTTVNTYTLTVATSAQPAGSENYAIGLASTTINIDSVTPTPDTIANLAQYDIQFDIGTEGGLAACSSIITITFPAGTVVQNGAIAGVTVEGVAAASATGTAASRVVVVTPAQNITGGTTNINVVIPSTALRNPTAAANYTLTVDTSVENQDTSPNYAIGTSSTTVAIDSVTPSPTTIGNQASYDIQFDLASDGGLYGCFSTITIVFPNDTAVTNGAIAGVTVEGVAAASATGTAASRTVVITPSQSLNGGTNNVNVVIPSTSLRNPTTVGSAYTLTVDTNVQATGTSPTYSIGTSSTQVTVGTITPNPATVGNPAQYTVLFNTAADGALVANTSTITIVFPNNTAVLNGSIGGVTVQGVAAFAANGTAASRTIVVTTGTNVAGGTNNVSVVIPSTALTNPTSAGNYQLTVATSVQLTAGTSPNYAITASSTPVTVVSVTPSPSTIGNYASYSIDFNTSADGALIGGSSQIIVTFPAGTVVAGGAIAGVTVEGIGATSATGDGGARTITIIPTQNISGSTSNVTIYIPSSGSAVRNPTTTGNYTLTVTTSVQPAGTSPNYAINTSSTTVTVVSATPNPNTIGNVAQYTIDFNTSADGALVGGTSTITVTFPAGTAVANGAISGVTVEGSAATSATGNSGARTITIVPSASIAASTTNVTILIPSSGSAVRNPLSSGNYSLTVATSVQTNAGTSPNYAIGLSSTSVSIDSVTPNPTTIGNQAQYNIQFDLAGDGGLVGSASTITIVFPLDTTVQNGAISGVTVDGVAAASATGTAASRTIIVTPAQTTLVGGTTNVNVIIPAASLRNPTTVNSYTLTVATSVQPAGTSPSYSIGLSSTTVAVTSVTPSPNTIGQPASYTIDFNTASDGALIGGSSQIVVTFPSDTDIQNGVYPGVTVEGIAVTSATPNAGARTVTIVPAQNIAGSTTNITLYLPSSNIDNPTTSGNYQLTVSTSVQPAGTSPQYVIGTSSTTVNVDSVTVSPTVIGNPALYTIDFDISSDGGLTGGVSTITVTFPAGTYVTNGSLSGITVEGVAPTSATGNNGARTITIVPSVSLAGGTNNVTLSIPTTAVRNPTTAANYTLTVATSLQPAGTSPQYSIGLSSTALAVGAVTVTPDVVGNQAAYSFDFNTASDGYLVGGTSQIVITFPSDTNVTNGSLSGITVEGVAPTSATGNSGSRTITIVPSANISGSTNNVTISIPSTAVRNPTSTGNYTLTVSTSPQPVGSSPSYSIGQSATTVVITSVVPNPSTIGNQGQYTINFNTAADGALVGGASHIVITFPSDTLIQNGAIAGVTVEGSAATSAIGSQASRTIDIIPSANIAGSFTGVTVVIPAAAVRNPTTGGSYTLTLATTPQPVGTSPNYSIGQSSTVVNVTSVTPNPTTIGNQSQYTIDFNTATDGALLGTVSQIIVTFPVDTAVTNGALTGVTVEGLAVSSATGNSAARTVTLVPSQNIAGGTASVTILIPATVLRNPTTINTYTLTVATTVQPAGTSPGYSIGQSSTVVNVTSVTPTPATIGNPAQYNIQFTTSADGALLVGSTITLVFPNNTAVLNGAISGITVNGTAPSSATGTSATRTITMTIASAIAASTAVTVIVPSTALTNPTTAGNYQLTVATSVQPAGNSPLYGIGLSATAISVTSVTPAPAVVGNLAAYTVVFATSSDGAIPAGTGTIIITFPNDTNVPNGALTGITINSVAPTSATGDTGNRRITLVPSANIGASTTVTVVVPLSIGVRNPTSTGNFTLSVASSAQPAGNSPNYAITQSATAVSITSVTPSPTTVGSDAQYTVVFSTSADGPLYNGISRIYLNFPSNTWVTTGAISGITVNGVAPSSATGNGGTRQINILIGANIASSTAVTVVVPSSALHNPTSAGNYTLTVSTTAQPAGTSPAYAITISGTPITVTAVAPNPSPAVVSTLSAYTVNFTTAVVLRGNSSYIFMVFPPSTEVPNGSISGVTVGGVGATSAVGDPAARLITIMPATDVSPSATNVAIPSLVILNPSIPGSVPMGVSTTAQPLGSLNYTIVASTSIITTPSVVPNPSRAGEIAEYAISFSVGAHGRLMGGNTISVQFPAGTTFPSGIPAGSITVNGTGNTGTHYAVGNYVNVLVPTGVSIANNGAVSLVFTTAALIRNPGQGGARLDDVHTDAEPTAVPSNYYIITADSQISAPTVTPNPTALAANAEYTVVFVLGTSGSLDAGVDHIYIIFNSQTTLPATVSNPSLITVNGTPATAVAKITNGFDIRSPIDLAAGASDKTVTIIFQTGVGIRNPTLPGNYTLQAYTTIENTPVTSNPYAISASTSTQITQPQLELSPAFINSYARYHLTFNTGALGGLIAGVSTIDIVFPAEFTLPAGIAATDILVNSTVLAAAPVISGQTLTLTVPVAVAQSGAVDIVILSSAHIQNPSALGSYTLTLSTSSEPTPVVSTAVQIRPSSWDDVVGYPNPLKWDESANKCFTFVFIPDRNVTLRLYTLDGKLVKTITKSDTTDRIVWNVNNERGKTVASGIYLYVLKGTSGEKRGKIGFLK